LLSAGRWRRSNGSFRKTASVDRSCGRPSSSHTSITEAAELGQRAGLGLDKIRAHSRHRSIATLMLYVDEHDQQRTQTTLADLVAGTLTA
jgi:hypothetical protein